MTLLKQIESAMIDAAKQAGIYAEPVDLSPITPKAINLREQIPEDLQAEIDYARNAWMKEKA